jgi:hypothetical protein
MLVRIVGTQRARSRCASPLAGVDHRGVDVREPLLRAVVDDGLVPEARDDDLEQGADVRCGSTTRTRRTVRIVARRGREAVGLCV